MDREIPKAQLRRENRRRIFKYGGIAAGVAAAVALVLNLQGSTVAAEKLMFSTAERGDIDASVSATGRVSPAFEEVITSPVSSRIVEVCHRPGDVVEAGTPLLRLDLASVQTEYDNLVNQLQMKRLQLEQLQADNRTQLSDLEMQVKVARMKLRRTAAELINERYLDSIGSGTTDRVREVELAYRSGELELQQLEQQLENARLVKEADVKVAQLDIDILSQQLSLKERTLTDAEIRAPRRATLTSISNKIGSQVGQGTQVAVIADLGHYRVDGEVAESHALSVVIGAPVSVRVGKLLMPGRVSAVEPTSRNGIIGFTVTLDNDSAAGLRAGLKPDVYVSRGLKSDVVRIANGSYYTKPGPYDLYVRSGDYIEPRRVELGEASYDYVEVVSGLSVGEEVVISPIEVKGKRKIGN